MRQLLILVAASSLVGCGIPKEQFDAKSLEAENYKRQYQDESGKTKALEDKIKQLQARIAEIEGDKGNIEKSKQETEDSKAQVQEALAQTQAKLEESQRRIDELTALTQQLAASKEELEKAKANAEKKSSQYETLARSLKDEIKSGKIELSELRGRMVVKMKDKILFSSGSTTINKEGIAALNKVADALKGVEGKIIRVEGHTDNVPVDPKGPFPSNWELSTTRALAVVKLLQEQGVPPDRLSAAGYGEFQPIASNKANPGRSLNRRIEIVLAPGDQAPGKPEKK